MTKYYSGVGSRETPQHILQLMTTLSPILQDDYTLRSGGAPGADMAFESGVTNGNMEIYLPWKGFNKNKSPLYTVTKEALELAEQYHPSWKSLNQAAQKLMARNCFQVLGQDLKTPSDFLICWTPDACMTHKDRSRATGGTGQAISIADAYGIPVVNMQYLLWKELFAEILGVEL